jgi:hypothetical protein
MKLLMIIADSALDEQVRVILHAEGLSGYSEIPDVLGSGVTGEKRGSRAFPGANNMYFTVASRSQVERIVSTLRSVSSEHEPPDTIRAFTIDADQEL